MWKARPSSLLDIDDPYVAYCMDEACAYIAEQMERRRIPKFEKPKGEAQQPGRTTNSELIEIILRETHQV